MKKTRAFAGLWLRLTAAFLLVALLGVGVVAVLANRVTTLEFRNYMLRGQLADAQTLADQLEAYYTTHNSWEGAAALLTEGHGQGRGSGQGRGQLYLADQAGRLVAGVSTDQLGVQLEKNALAGGIPLQVDGEQVGTLVAVNAWSEALTLIESEFLAQVNRALLWGGLGAVAAALMLGTLLAWWITSPVRQLTGAAERIAAGDLASRVNVRSGDEIGHLASAFNQMADNLARSDELRRRLTADVAHELRTPLSIIRGQIEAIRDGIFPPDEEHLSPIYDETLLLNRLVEDLRTLALAEAGQLPLQKVLTNPAELMQRAFHKFRPLASEKELDLRIDLDPQLPSVLIDPDRVDQVLTNLLANALRHAPAGGEVVLRAQADQELRISVADSGAGIPPDELPYVFERFWRGDKSRARDRGGAGLGLAIARQLVEAHGGRIWVDNQSRGGATFVFAIPLTQQK